MTAALEMRLFATVCCPDDAVEVLETRLAYLIGNLAWFAPLMAGVDILTLLYEHLYHRLSI